MAQFILMEFPATNFTEPHSSLTKNPSESFSSFMQHMELAGWKGFNIAQILILAQ